MPGKSSHTACRMRPHSRRPKQLSSSICTAARGRCRRPAWYTSSTAKCVMAIASAPPKTLLPPHCRA
eukprot:494198-Lingulodinium_polyedra.AAC.1